MKKDFKEVEKLELKKLILRFLVVGKDHLLSSNRTSSIYVDIKSVILTPTGSYLISKLLADKVPDDTDLIGGPQLGGALISISLQSYLFYIVGKKISSFVIRSKRKKHGLRKQIESPCSLFGNIVLVEDVITTGSTLLKCLEVVKPVKILTVVDRQEYLPKFKMYISLIDSIFTLSDLIT